MLPEVLFTQSNNNGVKMSESSIAFVFPGQGSQKVGMLAAAHEKFSVVRATFEEASEALGYDMWTLVQSGPQDALNLTETTQPVLLTSSVALWRAWLEEAGATPDIMAGHSLGEFSALVCAGALAFSDAVTLVRRRGEFMQTAVPAGQGAMAAIIGLQDSVINDICQDIASGDDGIVSAVNFNSPGQVVIAGHTAAVAAASVALKEAGAIKAISLPVSAPFHTSLMKPAGEQLAEAIADITIAPPEVPVVQNVHASTETDPEKIRTLLVEQIYSPVQWTACMQSIINSGATHLVECGPGKVLSGLARRIDKSLQCYSIENPETLAATAAELN
jgi:[acyl-carrier-protein] S-malonyltransferase